MKILPILCIILTSLSYDVHYHQQSESSLSRQKLAIKGVREMKGRGRGPSAGERRKRRRPGSITNGTQEAREQIEDDQKSNRTLALMNVLKQFVCGCQSNWKVSLSSAIKKQGGANFPIHAMSFATVATVQYTLL